MTDIPAGFRRIDPMDGVMSAFAPVYVRREPTGEIGLGFRIGPQHCNPQGHCHGGTWATMADVVMGLNVGKMTGLGGPTISMSLDFLGASTAGQWAEGSARVLRATPNLCFVECLFTADGDPVVRASGTFRRKYPPYRDFEAMLGPD